MGLADRDYMRQPKQRDTNVRRQAGKGGVHWWQRLHFVVWCWIRDLRQR
ncbi:MAG: hypothetical protein ACNA71_00670 [Kiritimatiellia bacterium]